MSSFTRRLAHLHSSEDGDSKVEDDTKSQLSTTNTVSGTLATTQVKHNIHEEIYRLILQHVIDDLLKNIHRTKLHIAVVSFII